VVALPKPYSEKSGEMRCVRLTSTGIDKHRNIATRSQRCPTLLLCPHSPRGPVDSNCFPVRVEVRVSQSFAGAFELPRIESYGFARN
jgi:hypothetical protein